MDKDVLDTPTPPDPWASLDAELDGLNLTTLLERLMARTGQTVPQMAASAEIEQPVLYKILNRENREFKAEHADRLLEDLGTQGRLTDPDEAAVWRKWLHVAAYVHFEEYKAALPRLMRIEDLQERLAALAEHLRQQYQALAQTYERTGGQFPAGVALVDVIARQLHARYGWIRVPEGCELREGNEDECTIVRFRMMDQPGDYGPDAEVTRIEPGRFHVRRKGAPIRTSAKSRLSAPEQIPDNSPERRSARFVAPEMVLIPSGAFWMGTSAAEERALKAFAITPVDDEIPAHRVEVSSFYIARYPVTNGEYRLFLEGAQGYETRKWWSPEGWAWLKDKHGRDRPFKLNEPNWNGTRQPVEGVSWYEAEAYCLWLSSVTGQPYRLPREAEWERAARGPKGSLWPWGNAWDKARCNSGESERNVTTPVDAHPQGAALWPGGAVEDLVGNAWEWCADWYDIGWYRKPEASIKDCGGPAVGSVRMLRGGSCFPDRRYCRAAYRYRFVPSYFVNHAGFRVVRSP